MEALASSHPFLPVITSVTGQGVRGSIYWSMTASYPILAEDARKGQNQAGYNVSGYGFYGFETQEESPGIYRAIWHCSASAD